MLGQSRGIPKPVGRVRRARSRSPLACASSRSLPWNSTIFVRTRTASASIPAPSIRAANSPALRAPPTETVATGTPAGIWTIDNNESIYRPVGARSRPGGDDRDASIGRAATEREGCEVGVRRQDHELVVSGLCAQGVHGIEHQVDVGAALALLGQRRAVDDAETRAREVRPELREDRGVQVAGSDQEPP